MPTSNVKLCLPGLNIAGIVTDVCVAHAGLPAVEVGYGVFVVTDASGTFNKSVRDASWIRMPGNGILLLNWFSVACGLTPDWRNDMEGLPKVLAEYYVPAHANLITSQNYIIKNTENKKD